MPNNSVTGEYFREFSADGKYKFVEIGGIVRRVSKENEAKEVAEIMRHEAMYGRNIEYDSKHKYDGINLKNFQHPNNG